MRKRERRQQDVVGCVRTMAKVGGDDIRRDETRRAGGGVPAQALPRGSRGEGDRVEWTAKRLPEARGCIYKGPLDSGENQSDLVWV